MTVGGGTKEHRAEHDDHGVGHGVLAQCAASNAFGEPLAQEREAELDSIAGQQAQVGWGSQIRSYVVQPYQMVKDLRTDVESGNVTAVLDGDLDEFMEGYLRWRRREAQ